MDDDDRETFARLRESLIEGYISVLHGLDSLDNQAEGNKFKMQIVYYLEALCTNQEKRFDFSNEMVCNIVDLYSDLCFILLNSPETKFELTTRHALFHAISERLESIRSNARLGYNKSNGIDEGSGTKQDR